MGLALSFAQTYLKLKKGPPPAALIGGCLMRGKSREEIAELIGVTVGSLQDTCSRLGIGLTYTGSRAVVMFRCHR
jgi:hypothetical protein